MRKRRGEQEKHSEGAVGLHMATVQLWVPPVFVEYCWDRANKRDGRRRLLRNLNIQHRQSTIRDPSKHSRNVSSDIVT